MIMNKKNGIKLNLIRTIFTPCCNQALWGINSFDSESVKLFTFIWIKFNTLLWHMDGLQTNAVDSFTLECMQIG